MQNITKYILAILMLSQGFSTLTAQIIVPTQTDEIIIDNSTSGKADPNDRIRYKVTIQNTGGADGTATQLNIVPDPRTAFVVSTFRSSPLALPDAYACTGNVGLSVSAASGLKANDFDDAIAGATITAGTFTTTQGGSIMIAADGSFMYTPPAGFTGSDSYTYTLNDGNGVGAPVPTTDMSVVTFTISNLIWFIDNSSVAATSDGRLSSPFKSLADFNAGSAIAGDVIYLEHTGTNYTGGIVLQDGERLFGEGHTGAANLSGVLPFVLAANSKTLPNINGLRPVITNAAAAGDGITLPTGSNTVRGVSIGNCADFAIESSNIGTLTISETDINTTGSGFRNTAGGNLVVTLSSLSSTGGLHAVNLTGTSGSFAVTGTTTASGHSNDAILLSGTSTSVNFGVTTVTASGANQAIQIQNNTGPVSFAAGSSVTGSSSDEILLSGGTGNITYNGTVTNTSGTAISILSRTSGTVDFTGNISHTAAGIAIFANVNTGGTINFSGASKSINSSTATAVNLASNTGTTINFTNGGLVITTTSGTGFSATGGGTVTVTVTGTGNTITSPTGTALNVNATTIGASNLNFQSISSASSATPTGIILDNTGSSGGLVVTGTGGAGSGGTIANKTGSDGSTTTGIGIYLNNTSNVSLTRMQLNDFQNFGISGNNVTNLTMANCVINGANGTLSGGAGEGSIYLLNLFGNNTVTSCTVSGGNVENFTVVNNSGTLTSLNVSSCTIQNNSTVNGNMGLSILSQVSANMTATVDNCIFKGNRTIAIRGDAADASILNVTFTNNNITPGTGGNNQGNQGIEVSRALTSSVTYNVTGNTVSGMISTLINIFSGGGNASATVGMTGVVVSNIVTGTGAGGNQFGIRVFNSGSAATGAGFINAKVASNTVSQIDNAYGILIESSGSTGPSAKLQASVLNNNVSVVGTALDCIRLQARNTATICAKVSGNTTNSAGAGFYGIQVRQANTATFSLEGLALGPQTEPTVHNFLVAQNPAAASVSSDGSVTMTITGVPVGTCSNIPN